MTNRGGISEAGKQAEQGPAVRSRGRTWLVGVAMAIALGLAAYLLADAWGPLARSTKSIAWSLVLAGWLVATISACTSYAAFVVLLGARRRGLSYYSIGHLYFAAQLLKHLPGRIWGLAYQGALLRGHVPLAQWVAVNIVHMLLGIVFCVIASITALAVGRWSFPALVIPVLGTLLVLLAWRRPFENRLVGCFGWFPSARIAALQDAVSTGLGQPLRVRVFVSGFFLLGWAMYFAAWALYGQAYPSLGGWAGLELAALYSLAWLVGYLAVVTPSGLGVREAAFAAISVDYPDDVVLYFALLGRVTLLGSDVVLGLLFLRPRYDETRSPS